MPEPPTWPDDGEPAPPPASSPEPPYASPPHFQTGPPTGPPPPAAPPALGEGQLLTIGDIQVGRNWIVTPNWRAPLAGSQWLFRDFSEIYRKYPDWVIPTAILGALICLLGLLALLVKKEERVRGHLEVTVYSGEQGHTAWIWVRDKVQMQRVRQDVAQVQAMANAGRG